MNRIHTGYSYFPIVLPGKQLKQDQTTEVMLIALSEKYHLLCCNHELPNNRLISTPLREYTMSLFSASKRVQAACNLGMKIGQVSITTFHASLSFFSSHTSRNGPAFIRSLLSLPYRSNSSARQQSVTQPIIRSRYKL